MFKHHHKPNASLTKYILRMQTQHLHPKPPPFMNANKELGQKNTGT
jgi:hypothetical protein